eukprot:3549425-Rhodomonas_salina.1
MQQPGTSHQQKEKATGSTVRPMSCVDTSAARLSSRVERRVQLEALARARNLKYPTHPGTPGASGAEMGTPDTQYVSRNVLYA